MKKKMGNTGVNTLQQVLMFLFRQEKNNSVNDITSHLRIYKQNTDINFVYTNDSR